MLGELPTEGIPPVEEESTLSYISKPEEEVPAVASSHDEPGCERPKSPASDVDVDAEGEVDPDYVPSAEDEDSAAAVVEAVVPVVSDEADDDPFAIKNMEIPTQEAVAVQDGKASLPSPVET